MLLISSKKVTSQKDVIELSLNITVKAVRHNFYAVQKLIKTRKGLTHGEKRLRCTIAWGDGRDTRRAPHGRSRSGAISQQEISETTRGRSQNTNKFRNYKPRDLPRRFLSRRSR
ncbi:hypothetical protein HAX54_025557 [Datura stramonium]|uniref:Uncharacterized protein n=1 Tax=Datura stramonium TaxID=4076 RepID=A0ABS8S743_DATST|nr:hypothetical protein [Datura stramonium]